MVTKFCRAEAEKFEKYIDYIDREEAVRTEYRNEYDLFMDYMENPEKSTGLFTAEKDVLTRQDKSELKAGFRQAKDKGSLMWQTVISFDNRWLAENGVYDMKTRTLDENKIKEVSGAAIKKMLKSEGLEHALWSASIHYNTDNIHIHVAIVETEPMREMKEYIQYQFVDRDGRKVKEAVRNPDGSILKRKEYVGRFKMRSIEACKSVITNELLNERENNIRINNIIRKSIIDQKKQHPFADDEKLSYAFLKLYQSMPDCARNMWNYNNPVMGKLRKEIDALSDLYITEYHKGELEELKARLSMQEAKYRTAYGNTGSSYTEGKMQDLHTRLGNTILKEIREYDKEIREEKRDAKSDMDAAIKDADALGQMPDDAEMERDARKTDYADVQEGVIRDPQRHAGHGEGQNGLYYKWSKDYKAAKQYIHAKRPDYDKAVSLLEKESADGNVLAMYELGDIYRYGRGREIDNIRAEEYYRKAFEGFFSLHETSTNDKSRKYLAYRIGKQLYYGLGVEQDFESARAWLEESGNDYSVYILGKMAYYGQGMGKSPELAFRHFTSIAERNAYAAYQAASMIERNEVEETNGHTKEDLYQMAFYGFMGMENRQADDNLEYKIGIMYLEGKGTDADKGLAEEYLEKSVEAGNVYAKSRLARLYLEEGRTDMLPRILEYLTESAEKNEDSMSMYTLGNIYASEEYGGKDPEKAKEWYEKAESAGNEFASYKLGKLYYSEGDFIKSTEHFEKCSSEYAHYMLGKIYLNKEGGMYDPSKGIPYLLQAAEKENAYAELALGILYLKGEAVQQDRSEAKRWLNLSAEHGNDFAGEILGNMRRQEFARIHRPRWKLSARQRRSLSAAVNNLKRSMNKEWEKSRNAYIHEQLRGIHDESMEKDNRGHK